MIEKIRLKMYPAQPRTGTTYTKRPSGLSFKQEVHNASELLKMIEKEGMTPPRYMALMRNGEKYDKDKHFGADVIDRVSWEPEDE